MLAMGESQAIECVKHFAIAIVEVFGEHYLRAPNAEDTARLLAMNEARGFPGMRVLSSTEQAPPRFSLVRSPQAHPGGPGMAWALRMDECPNPGENEEPRARLGRITPSE
jgi:hypothetical protein